MGWDVTRVGEYYNDNLMPLTPLFTSYSLCSRLIRKKRCNVRRTQYEVIPRL